MVRELSRQGNSITISATVFYKNGTGMLVKIGLVLIILKLLIERTSSHIFFAHPPSRAKCFYEYPLNVDDDSIFRGNPCGRASRGVQAHLSSNATLSLSFRMTVAHMSVFQLSIAPGIAGYGGKKTGTPEHTSYDSISTLIASFDCSHLPGGCKDDPEGRGDYCLPVFVPELPTGMYTLQLRQFAPEFNWYYYECADVLLVSNGDAGEATCQRATFTAVAYPNPIYSQEPYLFGIPGLIAIFVLLYDLYWVRRWGVIIYGEHLSTAEGMPTTTHLHRDGEDVKERTAVACVDIDENAATTTTAAHGSHFPSEEQESKAPTTIEEPTRTFIAFCALCWHVAARRRRVLAAQFFISTAVFLAMFGVDASLRNCSLHTFPEF
jgi:hypothetical protein